MCNFQRAAVITELPDGKMWKNEMILINPAVKLLFAFNPKIQTYNYTHSVIQAWFEMH